MAVRPTDLKKGTLYTLDGDPYQVVEYRQKVMGRGSSVVTVKARSLRDGKVGDKTFKGSENLELADVESGSAQYLYNDGATYYFMDQATFDQYEISTDMLGDNAGYLIPEQKVTVQRFEGNPINVELPKNVWLKVDYVEPAVKGNTSQGITKDARLETGVHVRVPIFIDTGDVISVDTETGDYRERQK